MGVHWCRVYIHVIVCIGVGCIHIIVCTGVGCVHVRVCTGVGCVDVHLRVCTGVGCVCSLVWGVYSCVCVCKSQGMNMIQFTCSVYTAMFYR